MIQSLLSGLLDPPISMQLYVLLRGVWPINPGGTRSLQRVQNLERLRAHVHTVFPHHLLFVCAHLCSGISGIGAQIDFFFHHPPTGWLERLESYLVVCLLLLVYQLVYYKYRADLFLLFCLFRFSEVIKLA